METNYCKSVFLSTLAGIYLVAFASIYHQIPGLYGDNGILPVRSFAEWDKRGEPGLNIARKEIPSLVWEATKLGIDFTSMMELISIIGMVLSAFAVIFNFCKNFIVFATLWVIYFSIYQVGQVFLHFQWDILLLETGILCLLIAPLFPNTKIKSSPQDSVTLWMIKWLIFRLMFASGVVKLTSMCPTWWGLTALNYHFESQCIPTNIAWYAHQLPDWILKLGVVGTYVIEIVVPFLFFAPIPSLRLFSFWMQIFFQISIILTGNYTFFNLLTIAICIPLLNDEQLFKVINRRDKYAKSQENRFISLVRFISTVFVYAVIVYCTTLLFNLEINPDYTISSKIMFNNSIFKNFLKHAVQYSIVIGAISFTFAFIRALVNSFNQKGIFGKIISLVSTLFYTTIAMWFFAISLVPHSQVDLESYRMIPPVIHKWHRDTSALHFTNAYGLFRRMTGVGGRPEIVIEGSNSLKSGWKEYHFYHKPGNVSESPKFIIPHQPRLDWQMWFAALDNYQNNPWLMQFVYRLLTNEKDVLNLLNKSRLPFKTAPKYVRIQMYTYKYTIMGSSKDYWQRTLKEEYMQPVTKESITEYLKTINIDVSKRKPIKATNLFLKEALDKIRDYVNKIKATTFVIASLITTITLNQVI